MGWTEKTLLRIVSSTVAMTRDWEDSPSRDFAWTIFIALMMGDSSSGIRKSGCLQFFLPSEIRVVATEHTVCIYSVGKKQMNLNLVITKRLENYQKEVDRITMQLHSYAPQVSIVVVETTGRLYRFCTRRMIPSRMQIDNVVLRDGKVTFRNAQTPVLACIASAADITNAMKPLTRMAPGDEVDVVYWHRFPCGTMATFHNPCIDEEIGVDPCTLSNVDTLTHCHPSMAPFAESFLCPCNNLLGMLKSVRRAPIVVQALCVSRFVNAHGITDDAIVLSKDILVGLAQHFAKAETPYGIMHDMHCVWKVMCEALQSGTVNRSMTTRLIRVLLDSEDRAMWHRWILQSSFIFACIEKLPPVELERLCNVCTPMLVPVAVWACSKIGRWTNPEVQKARHLRLCATGELALSEQVARIGKELERMDHSRYRVGKGLQAAEDAAGRVERNRTHKKGCRRHKQLPGCDAVRDEDGAPEESSNDAVHVSVATHHGLVERIRSKYGLDCILIGSGIFDDRGDCDLVVTVDDQGISLASAYERVCATTGWTPQYDCVNDDKVAVLTGREEGVLIDAQVWRGSVDCSAERETCKAIALARRLEAETDDVGKENVRRMHAWMRASESKAHKFCRVPGVAVTCTAVTLSCRTQTTDLFALLESLRSVLTTRGPLVRFDDHMDHVSDTNCVIDIPCQSLAVVVDEVNVAARMTVLTSKHLLDTVAYACSLSPQRLLDSTAYREWRFNHMFVACHLRPLTPRSISHSLYTALATLDGHPMLESLHVAEEEDFLTLRCTLNPSADGKYGFLKSDIIEPPCDDTVCIRRGARRVRLCISPARREMVEDKDSADRITDAIRIGPDACIPNAPYLREDMLARFAARDWVVW